MNIFKSSSIIPVAALLYSFILIVVSAFQKFYQFHNDFWDVFFVARTMISTDTATWFNPQYPVGYTFLLKLICGNASPILPAIILNCIFGGIIILVCGYFYKKLLSKPVVLLCLSTIVLFPTLFHYFTVGGGDPGSVFFFASGSALLFISIIQNNSKLSPFFFSGLLMGAGALFRYHVLPATLLLLVIFGLLYRSYLKHLLITGCALGIAYLPQIIVNLASGHAPMETQFGPMNVYDLMYSISWYQTITLDLPKSVFDIIAADPFLFLQKYLSAFISFSPYFAPQLIAFIIVKEKKRKQFCGVAALYSILYFLFFSAFTSGRQGLIILPLAILCTGILIESILSRCTDPKWKKAIPFAAIVIILLFIYKDFRKVQERYNRSSVYKQIENTLNSEHCKNVREVYSTDFSFYLPSHYPFIPFFNGGAPRWGTYKFNDEYPEFPVHTYDNFVNECRKRGVRFLVLTNNSNLLSPFFADIFSQKKEGVSMLFESEKLRVFKLPKQNLL
ncbi:MAG: hypothetical protein JW915_10300 [Chitinispirillaceae bacterium]|nr:hypothetical protein [Chitinispirillaceae bacterium]